MNRLISTCFAVSATALVCALGAGGAQAANLLATENGDTAVLVPDSNFDVTPFTSISAGESANGSGAFIALAPATGMALAVLTEATGGNSDWFELVYTATGGLTESVTAHWNSDLNPGGLPPLPGGVVPVFLPETGAIEDITLALALSAGASGFAFPSNITLQAQSDLAVGEVVPEPGTLALLGSALLGFGVMRRRRNRV